MMYSVEKIIYYIKWLYLITKPSKKCFCCFCEKNVGGFLPYKGGWKTAPKMMSALNVVGSDLDNFSCPVCFSHDRERHLWYYLNESKLLDSMTNSKILHFAPERHLSLHIAAKRPSCYIKADLFPAHTDVQKIDILKIPFPNQEFDFLIANHVLEHVSNLKLALSEIHRVLKPDGWAILQTPYASSLQRSWEDSGVQTANQRWIAYGQADHVRLFGQDIFEIIENAGFISHVKTHASILTKIDASECGVNLMEPFMLFKKIFE